jgi:hypothetical protein
MEGQAGHEGDAAETSHDWMRNHIFAPPHEEERRGGVGVRELCDREDGALTRQCSAW